ncbi:MOSC domain-containing protein [Octadecabacter sp. 1_MG-2023]|uniref:MOSC domain-containing protein n=1 Tax=unclassified Octadecabacter TaxID=196158 RepID=UPI001C0859D0|nr:MULTISPECIES: MOSC domain-containing protein [unclassified Octadecabacter]MBU2991647.1 MOSC domain-containing protein [Octadecabacter sp. B2R22]MDO6736173.1 MOSC domain-containing protein [Octadecabacter sp. 1_MG-2023]
MSTVAELWRHPIKSHGREALAAVALTAGKCFPWDRHWAVTHEKSKFDGSEWVMCRNFMIGAMTPSLAGLWATFDDTSHMMTLRHADLGEVTFNPETESQAFLAWAAPLYPEDRQQPQSLVSLSDRGITDSDYPSVSIMNMASHTSVEAALGGPLEMERWRGNIWLDGIGAWDELNWVGKTIRIGSAELEVREPIGRCMHTAANPVTGERDADTLGVLKSSFGHQDFGVYAVVTKSGHVALGDQAEVL